MIINRRIYIWKKNGDLELMSRTPYTYKISEIEKKIREWYRFNPYAKKVNENWICSDYRIDQQRPQRKVYSEKYIEIVSISEMEKVVLNEVIQKIESEINYPTVWDDGKNEYYEDTIHCPKCMKRRKVLTSHSHCEFCGFEFSKSKKCPKCKDLSPSDSNFCIHCGNKL